MTGTRRVAAHVVSLLLALGVIPIDDVIPDRRAVAALRVLAFGGAAFLLGTWPPITQRARSLRDRTHPFLLVLATCGVAACATILGATLFVRWATPPQQLHAAPGEVRVAPQTKKQFPVHITNTGDVALYDVALEATIVGGDLGMDDVALVPSPEVASEAASMNFPTIALVGTYEPSARPFLVLRLPLVGARSDRVLQVTIDSTTRQQDAAVFFRVASYSTTPTAAASADAATSSAQVGKVFSERAHVESIRYFPLPQAAQ